MRFDRCEPEAAISQDHRSDSVPAGNGAPWVPSNLRIVVGVQIDEARRHDCAVGIDGAFGEAGRSPAYLRDSALPDPEVRAVARYAGSVDNRSAFDVDVILGHGSLLGFRSRLVRRCTQANGSGGFAVSKCPMAGCIRLLQTEASPACSISRANGRAIFRPSEFRPGQARP